MAPSPSPTATPSAVIFNYTLGAPTLPAAQAVSVRNGASTATFTTSIAGQNSLWLTVSPDAGKLPGTLSLRANPTSLGVGQYSADVDVVVAGIAAPLVVTVTLNVNSPPSALSLSATTLTFTAPPSPVPVQTVALSTNGGPIAFTVTSGSVWMTVSPTVGVVLPGEQMSLTVTVDPTNLNPQATPYTGKITVVVAGGGVAGKSQNIAVSFTVNPSTPTITSIWPGALPLNAGPQTVTLRGTNFYSATVASVQGVTPALATTVLSPSALLAVVPAAQLSAAATLNIVVSNPAPGGSSTPIPLIVANVPGIGAIANVASYAATAVSPGELVAIFGTNIGPAQPVPMNITNGFVDTTLGSVTVTIDGQSAPILYASQNQVTVQVPYEAKVGTGVPVILTNGTNPPANTTVTVAATAPGIFTADGSGGNLAAALNYNSTTGLYSLNTVANPAHLGDTILLYLTGEGDFNPTLAPRTGLIVPSTLNPLPQLNPLPTVTIGGSTATVQYAGPLVGSILGLLQINCVVPATATTGQAVPVIVNIGGNNTQANVVLSIHP